MSQAYAKWCHSPGFHETDADNAVYARRYILNVRLEHVIGDPKGISKPEGVRLLLFHQKTMVPLRLNVMGYDNSLLDALVPSTKEVA